MSQKLAMVGILHIISLTGVDIPILHLIGIILELVTPDDILETVDRLYAWRNHLNHSLVGLLELNHPLECIPPKYEIGLVVSIDEDILEVFFADRITLYVRQGVAVVKSFSVDK